jgi:hypothetical protein
VLTKSDYPTGDIHEVHGGRNKRKAVANPLYKKGNKKVNLF